MSRFRQRADGDRGAVLVEFAFVIPIFLLLVFGLAEYSVTAAGNAAGGNAARDGARVGIINFANADHAGANYDLIVAAVNSRLAGLVKGTPTVTVSCVDALNAAPLAHGCDPQYVRIGSDMIKVQVRWTHLSPVGLIGNGTRTDSAVMRIVGAPGTSTTGGNSGACVLSSPTATPSAVNATGGVLDNAITFTVTVSSAADCGTPQLSLPSESGLPAVVNMYQPTAASPVFQYRYPTDYPTDGSMPSLVQAWTAGTKTAQMQVQAGLKTTSTSFSVTAPTSSCTFSTVTPNFVDVTLKNRQVKDNVPIALSVNDQAACAFPMVSVSGVTSPLNTPAQMSWNNGKYEFTIAKNENGWSTGTGTLTITGPGGNSTTVGIAVS